MTREALNKSKTPLSRPLLRIASGASSRADIHHFPQQHFTVDINAGVQFVKMTKKYIQKKIRKFSKIVELEKKIAQIQDPERKARHLAKTKKLKDTVAVKIAYSLGRISHTIQDARSHIMDPEWKLTLKMITGKKALPADIYSCRFGLPTELTTKGINFVRKLKINQFGLIPDRGLNNIYKSYRNVPTREFNLWNPKTWWNEIRRSHGFVNLDYAGSLRDEATKAATGKSAFKEAIRKAMKDTKKFWEKHILAPIKRRAGKEQTERAITELQTLEPDAGLFVDKKWEKIGERAFNIAVVNKLPKIKEHGPFSEFLFTATKPLIPHDHERLPAFARLIAKHKKKRQRVA